ncbi:MAG: MBL fold metallo-hydrolase, partial [Candidatus Aminicenantes bacterium]|nr:MBL fold metallo-hydrolase [Candidatus Aminicenantes bacterium]
GIVDIIKRAKTVTSQNIDVVLGGFHLMSRSKKALGNIIREFKEMGVKQVGATHCTGKNAIKMFKDAYGEDFLSMGAGRILEFH